MDRPWIQGFDRPWIQGLGRSWIQGLDESRVKGRMKNIWRSWCYRTVEDRFGLKDSLSIDDLTYDRLASVVDREVVEGDVAPLVDEVVQAVDELSGAIDFLRRPPALAVGGFDDAVDDGLRRLADEAQVRERDGVVQSRGVAEVVVAVDHDASGGS